jgi:PAS domain S-box-containing protein
VRLVRGPGNLVLVTEAVDTLEPQRAALEAVGNAVVITDERGVVEYINPAFTRLTGFTREEATGRSIRMLKSGQQDSRVYDGLWSTILAGATWTGTLVNRRKDGALYLDESTITPVVDHRGVRHFIAVKRDVTTERRLAALAERGERIDVLGHLAAAVAHDLANLLTPLSSGAEVLLKSPPDEALVHDIAQDMSDVSKRAVALVRQLLDFARGGKGLMTATEPTPLLRSYARQLGRLVPSQVRFEVDIADGLPTLSLDAMRLYQALLNLCVNAVDALGPGGGRILLTARAARRDGQDGVEVRVSDDGPGMEQEIAAHALEPFFTTKPPGKGTGLGLATVRQVMNAHGGSVVLDTAPGAGTTFTLFLPGGAR